MTLRTINVAIALAQIFEGAPVAGARVRLELTGPDVDGATLVLPKSASVVVDDAGENTAAWWANADGSQGTQTKVTVYDADGKLQFEGLATFPAYDCTLTEALQLVPDDSVTDAQRWALTARDWAISPTDVEPGLPSAKTSAAQALADRLLADADVQATQADVQATHTDAGKTAGDVVTTNATKAYVDSQFAAFLATLSPALAIMLGYAGTAQAAVGQAQVAALQALSVAQQDLSGVSGQALHRTNQTVLGTFPIDTTKDSDPTWMDRMASASWYQEAATSGVGAWIPHASFNGTPSEVVARALGGTLGPNLVAAANGTLAGWGTNGSASLSVVSGRLRITNAGAAGAANWTAALTASKTYLLTSDELIGNSVSPPYVRVSNDGGGTWTVVPSNTQTGSCVFVAPTTANYLIQFYNQNSNVGFYIDVGNFALREVQAWAPSGSFFNDASDGKNKRLLKNLWPLTNKAAAFTSVGACAVIENAFGSMVKVAANAGANVVAYVSRNFNNTGGGIPGARYSLQIKARQADATRIGIRGNFDGAVYAFHCLIDLTNGAVVNSSGTTAPTVTPHPDGDGSYLIKIENFKGWNGDILIEPHTAAVNAAQQNDTFTAGQGVYVGNIQHELSATCTTEEDNPNTTSAVEVFRSGKAKLRKGVGVIEASRVTVYDLDEPGRPMWMVFVSGAAGTTKLAWNVANQPITSAAYKDGVLSVGMTNNGVVLFNLANDDTQVAHPVRGALSNRTIAARNSTTTFTAGGGGGYAIGSAVVNGVAMATMRDAPVDPMTGLAIPTIALALQGGTSTLTLLKPDGSVVGASYTTALQSVILDRHAVYGQIGGTTSYVYASNPSAQVANFVPVNLTVGAAPQFGTGANNTGHALTKRGEVHVRSGTPMVASIKLNELSNGASLTRRITDVSNTGWMVGDERGAWLSDVSSGALQDVNLATNGTFDADLSSWTVAVQNTNSIAWNAGKARVTFNENAQLDFTFPQPLVAGRTYRVRFDATRVAGTGIIRIQGAYPLAVVVTDGNNDYEVTAATSGTIKFTGHVVSAGTIIDLDNVIVQEVAGDRSAKANPLTPVGTVQKTPVASLAQLVAYYGFSAANYLRQAYSVSLDFATGGFALLPWVSVPTVYPSYVAHNLLVRSQEFDNGAWVRRGSDTVTANAAAAPDATLTADKHVPSAVNADHYLSQAVACAANTDYTESVYFKAAGYNFGYLKIQPTGGQACYGVIVDLTTGTMAQVVATSGSVGSYTITDAGGGWWRVSVTTTMTGSTYQFTAAAVPNAAIAFSGFGDPVFTGDGVSGAYLWGAQLVRGGTAMTYTPTTAAANPGFHAAIDRSGAAGAYWRLGVDVLGHFVGEVNDGVNPARTVTTTSAYLGAGWVLPELSLSTSGALTLKVNGTQVAQTTGTPLASLNNAAAVLTVGNRYDGLAPFPGSIALVRVGATIPTDDQSRFVYDQEKAMFQPGAQVTLADSGAVVALTGDVQQNLLITGSAANESTFSGCVRVASAPAAAGSIANITSVGGVKCVARTGTNAGVDVTIPARNLREDLDYATRTAANDGLAMFEWVGGFLTNTTTGSAILVGIPSPLPIPAMTTVVGAAVTANGGFAGTRTITSASPTFALDGASTFTGAITLSFLDYILPQGWEPRAVFVTIAGATKRCREGSTLDYVVWFDGFRYRVRFVTAPGATAVVQIDARQFEMRKAA